MRAKRWNDWALDGNSLSFFWCILLWFHCPRLFTRAIYLQPWLRDVHTLLQQGKTWSCMCSLPIIQPLYLTIFQATPKLMQNIKHLWKSSPLSNNNLIPVFCVITHPRGRIRPEEFHLEKPNFSKETSVKPSTSRDTKPANPIYGSGQPMDTWLKRPPS